MMMVSLLNGSSVVDIGNDGGVESSSIVALFRAIVATVAGAYVPIQTSLYDYQFQLAGVAITKRYLCPGYQTLTVYCNH